MGTRPGRRLAAASLLALALAPGCAAFRSPVVPPFGWGFNMTSAPVDIAYKKGETRIGEKKGAAKSVSVLWLFAFGDASVREAARNGGVEVIDHVDCNIFSLLLGVYASYETVVWGRGGGAEGR